jgi:hypothetical protein
MKKFTLTIIAAFVIITGVNAQALTNLTPNELNTLDLSGKYTGQRHQFSPDKKTIIQSFVYEFDLTQTGDKISGVSTIIKDNGEYADIKLRGMIVRDKLYFEEYQTITEDKDPTMVWCYKTGALTIQKDGDNLKLTGNTDSYIPEYYIPCTGGTTDLTKIDNTNNFKKDNTGDVAASIDAAIDLGVSPNPFAGATKISYSISNSANVTLEVYDIQGQKVSTLENNTAKIAGAYNVDFIATGVAAGVLIAKLTVNGKVYSSEMVQMK